MWIDRRNWRIQLESIEDPNPTETGWEFQFKSKNDTILEEQNSLN